MSTQEGSSRKTELSEKAREGTFWGTVASILGITLAALGIFFLDIVLEFAGILLGTLGYGLGARKLGIAAVTISTLLLLVFLAAGQGEIPGLAPRDPIRR